MNSPSSGSAARPSRARRSERRTTCSNSASEAGSRQSASREATSTTSAPKATVATMATDMASARRMRNEVLKPSPTATIVIPTLRATTAAKSVRRRLGVVIGDSGRQTVPCGGRNRSGSRPGSPHRPRDDDALDLVGALVDLGDLGVAHVALDRILLDVAVAAEDLDGLDGDAHRVVGGEELGHRAVLGQRGLAAVGHRARLVEQLARGGGAGLHVGELELDRLQVEDRLAEGDALARVLRGVVGRALGDAHGLRGGAQPRALECPERDAQAPALVADEVLVRHPDVLEDRRAGGRALDAQLALELADRQAGTVLLDDEGAEPAVLAVGD